MFFLFMLVVAIGFYVSKIFFIKKKSIVKAHIINTVINESSIKCNMYVCNNEIIIILTYKLGIS